MSNKYSFRKQIVTCEEILSMIESGTLRFSGYSYGSNSRWTIGMKRMFISQMLTGVLLSDVILDGSDKTWHVIGGERQLKCVYDFVRGNLVFDKRENTDYLTSFGRLPLALKRKLLNLEISASVLNAGVNNSSRYQIYEMVGTIEGFSSLWPVAKIIFPDGFVSIERLVNLLTETYPIMKPYRQQLIRLPLLWWVRNDIAKLIANVPISSDLKIDAVLIPLLEDFHIGDDNVKQLIEDFSFSHFDGSKNVFTTKGVSSRLVLLLLLIRKIVNPKTEKDMVNILKRHDELWKEMPDNIRGDSYLKLGDQINYIANKIIR